MASNVENRLRLVRKELELTQEALAERMGVGKSALSMIETGKAALSERNKNILANDLNVNPQWLDSGKGSMFSGNIRPNLNSASRNEKYPLSRHNVPLYSLESCGGLEKLFEDNSTYRPVDYIYIPNLPKCDGAISITGEGIYPMLKSGDIILYKKMNDLSDIFWGDMYLLSIDVEGEEYITVKYIQKSPKRNHITLVGQNSRHTDKEIEVSKIRAIAFIKASIRINSLR